MIWVVIGIVLVSAVGVIALIGDRKIKDFIDRILNFIFKIKPF